MQTACYRNFGEFQAANDMILQPMIYGMMHLTLRDRSYNNSDAAQKRLLNQFNGAHRQKLSTSVFTHPESLTLDNEYTPKRKYSVGWREKKDFFFSPRGRSSTATGGL
jgi:hypothetical protein